MAGMTPTEKAVVMSYTMGLPYYRDGEIVTLYAGGVVYRKDLHLPVTFALPEYRHGWLHTIGEWPWRG